MSPSGALRVQDVRDAHRLIGECREVGADPALWHRHMLEGFSRLLGVTQASGGEGRWARPAGGAQVVSAYEVSGDPTARAYLLAYQRANGAARDPIFAALAKLPGSQITRTRRQLVPDAAWYRSPSFDEYRRPARIDHELTSIYQVSVDGAISCISFNRAVGDRDFSTREQLLIEFFHAELGRLIGGVLVSATEPGLEGLSPRLHQTLACLLEGDSEKQVAARLGVSAPTVHQYATGLYRYFRVGSRAQLLAHAMRRLPNGPWRDLVPARAPLAGGSGPGLEGLSPRLRQTLGCLMEGDSEKQAAARLGLSPSTVHPYVTALYRHFRVRSRAQLLAHVMKRLPNESWSGHIPRS
jgi:DNA-binding CsgD family transcriptional regulator